MFCLLHLFKIPSLYSGIINCTVSWKLEHSNTVAHLQPSVISHLTCSLRSPDWLHSPAAHLQQSSRLARVLLRTHTVTTISSASHLHVSLLCRRRLPLSSAARLSPGKTRQDSSCPRPSQFCFSVFGSDPPLVVVFYSADFTATDRLRRFPVFLLVCN